jgi:hypothetical protein
MTDYGDLRVGEPQEFPTTAFRVNGICDHCHTVIWGCALTAAAAVGRLKRHYRAHVKSGHSKAPGQERWVTDATDQ